MSEEHLLSLLKESGEILFVYCDKHNFYMAYKPYGEKILYLVTCDKSLYVNGVDKIVLPDEFFTYRSIRFFKPVIVTGKPLFSGLVITPTGSYRFTFDESGKQSLESFNKELKESNSCNLLPIMKNIEVTHSIQRGEKFYFTGIEDVPENGEHPVYGVVDLTSGKFEKIYCLYSDMGETETSALTIDHYEHTVYVVGKILKVDENGKVIDHLPYLEQFFYRG